MWYHLSCLENSEIVFLKEPPTGEDVNWFGPFKTFAEAKKDAVIYHQTDLDTARNALAQVRSIRKADCEGKSD